MTPAPRPPPTALFTVRLWQELVDVDQCEWRGEVKQIASGETHYFRTWEILIQHIVSMITDVPRTETSATEEETR